MTIRSKFAAVALAGALLIPGAAVPAFSAPKYDGNWSVVIITEQGSCDRAYRYPVKVVNGNINYLNEAGISITGRIDAQGRLKATIRRGEQHADGSGRLGATTGAGTWSGKDSATQCSGRWEAERRDG